MLIVDRTHLPLQPTHGRVAVEPKDQAVAARPRRREVAHMPRVEDVKTAVGKDNALPRRAQRRGICTHLVPRHQHGNLSSLRAAVHDAAAHSPAASFTTA